MGVGVSADAATVRRAAPVSAMPEPVPSRTRSSAATLLQRAVRNGVVGGIAAWQIFLAVIVFVLGTHPLTALAAVAHGLLGLVGVVLLRRGLPALPYLLAHYPLIVVDYAIADDPRGAVAFAAVWTASLMCATPFLILRPSAALAVSLSAAVVLTGAQIVLRPDWPLAVRLIVAIMAGTLAFGSHAIIRVMQAAAELADEQAERAQEATASDAAARRAGREVAEDARLLHDTAINTLGAIAQGATQRLGLAAVRARAADDAELLAALQGGLVDNELDVDLARLRARTGIEVVTSGLSMADLERLESTLPDDASRAIRRAIAELVANAAEHAGVELVRVDAVITSDRLVVSVSDAGAGFDGRLIAGRGLTESVFRRCREAGVDVELHTAPGRGTRVVLTASVRGALADRESPIGRAGLDTTTILRAGCWAWAVVITLATLAVCLVSGAYENAVSTCVVGLLALLSWRFSRGGRSLPRWLTAVLALSVPVVFGVSFAVAVEHDMSLVGLPAILLTVPLMILLLVPSSSTPLHAALVALGLAVLVACYAAWLSDPAAVLLPVVAVFPQLGLFEGCRILVSTMRTLAVAHEEERRRELHAATDVRTRAALAVARERWVQTAARSSAVLLQRIADGELDPRDDDVRESCAEEEAYLRQLLLLDAELMHLGPWLARALAQARARRIDLRVRGGACDAADAEAAEEAGRLLLTAIDRCEEGESLSIGIFPEGRGIAVIVFGPPAVAGVTVSAVGETWTIESGVRAGQGLLAFRS